MQTYLLCKDTPLAIYNVENNSITLEKVINKPHWLYIFNPEIIYWNWLRFRVLTVGEDNIQKLKNHIDKTEETFIKYTKLVSMSDTFWMHNVNDNISWSDVNPFKNKLTKPMFTGMYNVEWLYNKLKLTFKEPTYNLNIPGTRAKCWVKEGDTVMLYKTYGPTIPNNPYKYRPYIDYYASQVIEALGLDDIAVKYDIKVGIIKDDFDNTILKPYSICKNFASEMYSFIPMRLFPPTSQPINISSLGTVSINRYNYMLLIDTILKNGDRHNGNYGFLLNNDTLEVKELAPLFDFDYSLGSCINLESLTLDEALQKSDMPYSKGRPFGESQALNCVKYINKDCFKCLSKLTNFYFTRLPPSIDLPDLYLHFMYIILQVQLHRIQESL